MTGTRLAAAGVRWWRSARWRWADLPLNVKGAVVVAIPLLVLAVNWASLLYLTRAESSDRNSANQAATLTQSGQDALSALLDAETGVRGYLLSGKVSFLQPYGMAVHQLPALLDSLKSETREPNQLPASRDIARLIALAHREMGTLNQLRASAGAPVATLQPALALGKTTMDEVRQQISRLIAYERARVAAHDRALSGAEIGVLVVLILTIPLGLAGGVLAMALFTRGIGRRIGAVKRNAARLPLGLDLAPVADAADEVGQLARAVNEAAGLLAQREAEAREATLAAQNASQAKTEFLSRMSHELRTPLNAILGFGQLLEMESKSADDQESVEQILKAGHHLLDLINEILDLARIEQGRLALSIEPVDAGEVVEESVQLMRPAAHRAGCDLRTNLPSGPCLIQADRQRLKQVMLNLLSNALKYNRPGGWVAVDLIQTGTSRVGIRVSDSGIGIPEEMLPRLFNPFDRLGRESGSVAGTGLGLALCKSLVEAMSGAISVTSAEGRGTEISIDFGAAVAEVVSEPSIGARPQAAFPDGCEPEGIVLYIEDNLSNLRLVERLVRDRPLTRVMPAMQGQLGLELAAEHAPKLILLDHHLPDIDGIEVLRRLRALEATSNSAIYMLTADASPGQRERYLAAGADGYLTKPVNVKDLLQIVDQVLTCREPAPAV